MAGYKFTLYTTNFRETMGLLNTNKLIAPPWKSAMEEVGKLGQAATTAAAPLGHGPGAGRTINKMSHKVQARPVPLYVVVKTTAQRNGYAYPRFTNFSPWANRYKRTRNPNQKWFTNALRRVESAMDGILEKAGNEVERIWGSSFTLGR